MLYISSAIEGKAIILKLMAPKYSALRVSGCAWPLNRNEIRTPAKTGRNSDNITEILASKSFDNSTRNSSQNGINRANFVSVIG